MGRARGWVWMVAGWLVASQAWAAPPAAAPNPVQVEARAILEAAYTSDDWSAAGKKADDLFARATASRGADAAGFTDAAGARRLARFLGSAPQPARVAAGPVLRHYPDLAQALALLVQPQDSPEHVLNVIADLYAAHGGDVGEYAALTAAVAVVHDQPKARYRGEGLYPPATAAEVFGHFTRFREQMSLDVRSAPGELLVFLAHSDASAGELKWALREYAGSEQVGRAFFDVPYDMAHFKSDREKRIDDKGYTLPNLKRYGGICADQAYFATHVGRAIGVPSVYVWARGGSMSHAWPGFLENGREGLRWNFDFGRYPEYRGVRGNAIHPQTGEEIADGELSVTALLFRTPEAKRRYAVAAVDAAERLLGRGALETQGTEAESSSGRNEAVTRAALMLAEEGLRSSPAHVDGWRLVSSVARDGGLSGAEKTRWAEACLRLCGKESPDFAIDVLGPMIKTVADPVDQVKLWDKIGEVLPPERKDLAAHVLMAQADAWLSRGKKGKAGECYVAVVERYVNAGPFAIEALEACADMLVDAGRTAQAVELYADAWKRTEQPGVLPPDRVRESNWYKVGHGYATRLASAGDLRGADRVRQQLGRKTDG